MCFYSRQVKIISAGENSGINSMEGKQDDDINLKDGLIIDSYQNNF
jgi:hypothetical protein